MEESQFYKFKEDKLRVFARLKPEGIAQPQWRKTRAVGQAKVVKCYNYLGEGHITKHCTQPKRLRNSMWFKEKLMLVKAQEVGHILDEEQLAFIADPGIVEVQVAQQTIPHNSAFQTEDLDVYDSDCDDISSAKAILMENLSSCDLNFLSKTRVQSKEHCASLIAQINAKSVENSDLNAQLQEKVFAIVALKNELRKIKGKNIADTVVSKPIATIALGMIKLDIEPISHILKNNRDAHEVYLEKTIENTDTLRGLVECARK
ncbi:hypothetical protein Tco_1080062 [Tanacetum coccineum]|uniref:Retrovirus-related Pol polyprotein from transposon TNT 1-94 n=1 Tax=Tanacetum coccineum TaxID=301880 RepID=A0ABQ5HTN9_9ASTR